MIYKHSIQEIWAEFKPPKGIIPQGAYLFFVMSHQRLEYLWLLAGLFFLLAQACAVAFCLVDELGLGVEGLLATTVLADKSIIPEQPALDIVCPHIVENLI